MQIPVVYHTDNETHGTIAIYKKKMCSNLFRKVQESKLNDYFQTRKKNIPRVENYSTLLISFTISIQTHSKIITAQNKL